MASERDHLDLLRDIRDYYPKDLAEPSGETPAPLNLITALSLARDTGAKVRPVCWRNYPDYVWNGNGCLWRYTKDDGCAMLELEQLDELLGPWEVVP